METEHYVLTADSHDGLPCTVLLLLSLRLFPGKLAFNHTSRPDNHNRQRHPLWGPVTWPCLLIFSGVIILKKSLEHSDVLCRKSLEGQGTVRCFHHIFDFN